MELSYIIGFVTIVVTWVLGELSKKSNFINNNMIPLQNLIIGIIAFGIDYVITKDFNAAIIFSGLTAGGMYDFFNNLKEIMYDILNNLKKIKKGE